MVDTTSFALGFAIAGVAGALAAAAMMRRSDQRIKGWQKIIAAEMARNDAADIEIRTTQRRIAEAQAALNALSKSVQACRTRLGGAPARADA